jgi:hypothetical protein
MLKVIDCETTLTLKNTLERITGVSIIETLKFLEHFPMKDYFPDDPCMQSYPDTQDKLLLKCFKENFKVSFEIDITNWFHLTRVKSSDVFENGIIPLNLIVEEIWAFLQSLSGISVREWEAFRILVETNKSNTGGNIVHSASQYISKINKTFSAGPHGILIKDNAFKASELRRHDYLKIPEIVQDICRCYSEYSYGYSDNKVLEIKYVEVTKPYIVKFRHIGGQSCHIGNMLLYLYSTIHNEQIDHNCDADYNAMNSIVKPENIIYVESVENYL